MASKDIERGVRVIQLWQLAAFAIFVNLLVIGRFGTLILHWNEASKDLLSMFTSPIVYSSTQLLFRSFRRNAGIGARRRNWLFLP